MPDALLPAVPASVEPVDELVAEPLSIPVVSVGELVGSVGLDVPAELDVSLELEISLELDVAPELEVSLELDVAVELDVSALDVPVESGVVVVVVVLDAVSVCWGC